MSYSSFHNCFAQLPDCIPQSVVIYSFMRYLLQFTLSYIIHCTGNIVDSLHVFMNKTGKARDELKENESRQTWCISFIWNWCRTHLNNTNRHRVFDLNM
jgi:hypothetical protein